MAKENYIRPIDIKHGIIDNKADSQYHGKQC